MLLLDKLTELKDRFLGGRAEASDVRTIDAWIDEAKRLLLIQSLKNHDGIKYVLEVFANEVRQANQKLRESYSKDLPDNERDRLLDRRDLAKKYLNLFAETDEKLELLEAKVDEEL